LERGEILFYFLPFQGRWLKAGGFITRILHIFYLEERYEAKIKLAAISSFSQILSFTKLASNDDSLSSTKTIFKSGNREERFSENSLTFLDVSEILQSIFNGSHKIIVETFLSLIIFLISSIIRCLSIIL
jgi:hypothetical protein